MAKTYINAELQIVRMNNNDIVTNSIAIGSSIGSGQTVTADAPERRKSIWD